MVRFQQSFLFGVVLMALVTFAEAQVVRESSVGSVVGLLNSPDFVNEFTFKSDGNEVLIVDLDAHLYRGAHGGGGDHSDPCEEVTSTTSSEEGCTEPDEGGCDETDHTAGPPGFYLTVEPVDPSEGSAVGSSGGSSCFAGRPGSPGWERDPRLVCYLESEAKYLIRVKFIPKGPQGPNGPVVYVLNATLRGIAESGELLEGFEASKNEFPFRE